MMIRTLIVLPLAFATLLPAHAQQRHASARDAFWSASDLVSVAPNPAAHRTAGSKVSRPKATSNAPNDNGIVGEQEVASGGAPGSAAGTSDDSSAGRPTSVVQLVSANGYGAAPHLVRASESLLGLRYSVLLRDTDGAYAEVAPETVFHSGDHIRLSLMANEPGYLYVVEQGSSGSWRPIFPAAGASADANRIEQGKVQEVPGGTKSFQFDQQPGDEKVFVILSRQPIGDLDHRIEALKGKGPADGDAGPMLEAENRIPDVLVQRFASRDLTLVDEQKVDEAATEKHGAEKAVYVVSKAAGSGGNPEVVATVVLHHR